MTWSLTATLSHWLLRYYFGPDHPGKLRIWTGLHRFLGRPRFVVPYGEQAHLSLDFSDFIQFEILKTGAYEREVWDRLVPFVDAKEIIWDIGANIGSFTFLAAQHPGVRTVHCFEPNPPVFAQLEKNRRLNPDLPVQPHGVALSSRNEARPFFTGLSANRGVGGFEPRWNNESIEVPCFRGDDWIAQGHAPAPTLIKLDIEGAELEALQGLEATLRQSPPKAIIFEAHWGGDGKLVSQPVVDYLAALGFHTPLPESGLEGHPVNLLSTRFPLRAQMPVRYGSPHE